MSIASKARHPAFWVPVSLILLGVLAWRSRLWEIGDTLVVVDPPALVGALLVSGLIPLLWAARSSDLLGAAGAPVPWRPLVPMTVFANMINNVTPGSTGEVVRIWLLRAHHGVGLATGSAVVAIERLGAFGYLAGSAILLWLGDRWGWPPLLVAVLLGLLVAVPGVVYRLGFRPSAMITALPAGRVLGEARWTRASSWLRRVDGTMAELLGQPARLAVFALLTFGVLAGYTAQLVLVAQSIGLTLQPVPAWGALGIAITAGVLSMLPFGLGSSDLVLVALLGALGIPVPQATAVALGYRAVSTLPLGLGGVLSYAWLSASLPGHGASGVLRAMREEADGPPDAGAPS